MERQAQKELENARKAAEAEERDAQASWSVGANKKGLAKAEAAEQQALEKARKAKEKADLLAQDEAEISGIVTKKKPVKKKKDGDLDLLNAALASQVSLIFVVLSI